MWEWEADVQLDTPRLVKKYWKSLGGRDAVAKEEGWLNGADPSMILAIRGHSFSPRQRTYMVHAEWMGQPDKKSHTRELERDIVDSNSDLLARYRAICLHKAGLFHETRGVGSLEELDLTLWEKT